MLDHPLVLSDRALLEPLEVSMVRVWCEGELIRLRGDPSFCGSFLALERLEALASINSE